MPLGRGVDSYIAWGPQTAHGTKAIVNGDQQGSPARHARIAVLIIAIAMI